MLLLLLLLILVVGCKLMSIFEFEFKFDGNGSIVFGALLFDVLDDLRLTLFHLDDSLTLIGCDSISNNSFSFLSFSFCLITLRCFILFLR